MHQQAASPASPPPLHSTWFFITHTHSIGKTAFYLLSLSSTMADSSIGALVPSVVKTDGVPAAGSASETTDAGGGTSIGVMEATVDGGATMNDISVPSAAGSSGEMDRDLLCPICMGVIKDAFLTSCGHSFCYMCIVTHLNNKNDCPCCTHYLTKSNLFPNFLLDKV